MLSTVKFVCQQLFLTCYHTMLKCLFVNKFNANCEISHFVKSGPTNPTLPYSSWQICMNQTQRKRIYYPSLNLFVSCTSRCCKMVSFQKFIKSVMFYIS